MLTVRAPAKLNLDLRVALPRPDGFHPLSSWFVTTSLHDTLAFEPAEEDSLTCSDPLLPTDERNLVVRALKLVPHAPVRITLTKRIPVGGGLGGGSSDAAAALRALARLNHLDPATLSPLAALLGSDVPFFLSPPSALCTGRGEVIDPLPSPGPRAALLILPDLHVSTPAVFREFDGLGPIFPLRTREKAHEFYSDFAILPAEMMLNLLGNDLEEAAFLLHPRLEELRRDVEDTLSRPVRMSGSGSTLFTLYDTPAEAEEAAKLVKNVRVLAVEMCPLD